MGDGPSPPGVAETHSAVVFFVGDRVYKLKKPVELGFLDFRTREAREAREAVCHREVELNRRLAPDVYLGVADGVGTDGELCDHLVVMRRMPAERRLSTLVATGVPVERDPVAPGPPAARAVTDAHHAELVELECTAPVDVAAGRMRRRRAEGNDPSDATPRIARAMAAEAAPWPEAAQVDTTGQPAETLATALTVVAA